MGEDSREIKRQIKKDNKKIKFISAMYIAFIGLILISGLANILQFNGVNTAEVSSLHEALFNPTKYIFIIWIALYIALFAYLLGISLGKNPYNEISAVLFIVACALNSIWIILWHYHFLKSSLFITILLLITLGIFYARERKKKIFSQPISIYLAWISVLFLANISFYLVSVYEVSLFTEMVISILFMLIGLGLGVAMLYMFKDYSYNLVLILAYFSIFIQDLKINFLVAICALAVAATLLGINLITYFKIDIKKFKANKEEKE